VPPQSDHAVNDYPGFRDYLEDLWYHRSPKEWEILLRCAGQTAVSHNATLTDLRRRGLITRDGLPFSALFGRVIPEYLPTGKDLKQVLNELAKGAESANKLFDQLLKLTESAGKLYPVFRDPDDD
jgi:hypothetical protein